jgi:hypothetical protein
VAGRRWALIGLLAGVLLTGCAHPPAALPDPPVPPPAPLQTPAGVARWAADLDQPDSVRAGFTANPRNRELGDGVFDNPTLPWPLPTEPAPGGPPGRTLRFTLPDQAVRLEVEPNHKTFSDGDDAWFGFSFFLDPAFPLSARAFQVIEQLHAAPPHGSPPVSFQAAKGGLLLDGGWGKPGAADPAQFSYQRRLADLVVGRWYDVVYHVHFSLTPQASVVDVWLDQRPVLLGFHPPGATVYPAEPDDDHVGTYRKEGLYHSASIPGGTLFMAGQRLGVSFEDASPRP